MTVIAALVAPDGSVWMGADSRTNRDGTLSRLNEREHKVFALGPAVFAVSGYNTVGVFMRHGFALPELPDEADAMAWLCRDFCPALRAHLQAVGAYDSGHDSEGNIKGTSSLILVGVHGRLFELDYDLQPTEIGMGYHAAGNGEDVALGAMRALTEYLPSMAPAVVIEAALEAACAHRDGCAPPFVIMQCEDTRTPRLREIQGPAVKGSITVEQARDAFARARSA